MIQYLLLEVEEKRRRSDAAASSARKRSLTTKQISLQLAASEDVSPLHQEFLRGGAEHPRNLPPGQPDCLAVETDFDPIFAVAAFANGGPWAGAGLLRFIIHPVAQAGPADRPASVQCVLQRLAGPERRGVRRADCERLASARVPALSGGPALPGETPETRDGDVLSPSQ